MDMQTHNLPSITNIDWDQELRGAAMLRKSGFTPKDINSDAAALFVIMAGRDMGLSAVQSLRGIRPIQGKLELSADLQLGMFHRGGGKSSWLVITDREAKIKLIAPWSLEPHVSSFTLDDAKRAGLLSNQTWTKYPKAMLRSRAITQGLKDIGYIVGSGVYAPGELGGGVLVDEQTGEVLPGERTMAQKMVEADIQPTAGAVQALSADTGEQVALTAQLIREALAKGNTSGAFNCYIAAMGGDNADEKVALKRILKDTLQKDEAKKMRVAYDEFCRAQIDNIPKAELGAEPSIEDVRAHIKNGDFDTAADVARSLRDPAQRKAAEQEVESSHSNMVRA